MKKLLSLITSLTMILSLVILPVNAADNTLESILNEQLNTTEESVTITLNEDLTWTTGPSHGSTPLIPATSTVKTLTIDGNGNTLEAIGAGVGSLRAANGGTIIFKNLTIKDSSVSYAEDAWEFTYLEFSGKLVFENVTFESGITLQDESDAVVNATFNKCSFNSPNDSEYALWVSDGDVVIENCTFEGTRGLKVHEAYGSEVNTVIVNNTDFIDLSKKPGIALGTLNDSTEISIINCTFEGCQVGDQGLTSIETDTNTDSIKYTFKENVENVLEGIESVVKNEEELRLALTSGKKVIAIDENITLTKPIPFGSNNTVKLIGLDGNEVLDSGILVNTASGCNVTFEDLTIKVSNTDYKGLQHSTSETYINCVIEGTLWLYGNTASFEKCTFKQENPNSYNIWTYGSKDVTFKGCVFETAGKSVLVYNEGTVGSSVVKFDDCKFIANDKYEDQEKAAIEIDGSLIPGTYTVNTNNTIIDCQIVSGLTRNKKNTDNVIIEEKTTSILHGNTNVTNEKDETCTEQGYTGDLICTDCEELVEEGTKTPALGHNTEVINKVDATCTETGYTGDKVCTVCEETIEDGEETEALGHTYEDGVCSVCDAKEPSVTPNPDATPTPKPEKDPTKTGDDANIALFAGLAVLAAGSMYVLRRKEEL